MASHLLTALSAAYDGRLLFTPASLELLEVDADIADVSSLSHCYDTRAGYRHFEPQSLDVPVGLVN